MDDYVFRFSGSEIVSNVGRCDGTPYLEVHHKVQLADGGEDSLENAVALCPNCHREAHYGVNTYNPA